jgi:hypothetical protein
MTAPAMAALSDSPAPSIGMVTGVQRLLASLLAPWASLQTTRAAGGRQSTAV